MLRGDIASWVRFPVLQDERVLAMDGDDGCTTIRMYLITLNCIHLKIVTMASFMLFVFHHNFKEKRH